MILMTACSGAGDGPLDLEVEGGVSAPVSTPLPNPGSAPVPASPLESDCVNNFDCDGDGIITRCDVNDQDANVKDLNPVCTTVNPADDIEAGPGGVHGDGYKDVICRGDEIDHHLCDNCPTRYNPDQANSDSNPMGDACQDPGSVTGLDPDGDGWDSATDNCPNDANLDQADLDGDGIGDICDGDRDGDGVLDTADNCFMVANADQRNADGDTQGDKCDDDDDGDGINNTDDRCPFQGKDDRFKVAGTHLGSWNGCYYDTDGDEISDRDERQGCLNIRNTIANADDTCADADGDGYLNSVDADDDNDGLNDQMDLCPLHKDDNWKFLKATKTVVDWVDFITGTDGRQLATLAVNGQYAYQASPLNSQHSILEEVIVRESRAMIDGLSDDQRFIRNRLWEGINPNQASNSDATITSCVQATVTQTFLHYTERTICGTFQSDADGDGIGTACDPDDHDSGIPKQIEGKNNSSGAQEQLLSPKNPKDKLKSTPPLLRLPGTYRP